MPTELDLEPPAWLAPDPREEVLARVRRRSRVLQWQRRLPAIAGGLAMVVVAAATALSISGPSQQLRTADQPEDERTVVQDEQSTEQVPTESEPGADGGTTPADGPARPSAAPGGSAPVPAAPASSRATVAMTSHPLLNDAPGDTRSGDVVSPPGEAAPEVDILSADIRLVDEALVFRIDVQDAEAFRQATDDGSHLGFVFRAQGPQSTTIEVRTSLSRSLSVVSSSASMANGQGAARAVDGASARRVGSAVELSVPLAAVNAALRTDAFAKNRVGGDPSWREGSRLSSLAAEVTLSRRVVGGSQWAEVWRDDVFGSAERYWAIGS